MNKKRTLLTVVALILVCLLSVMGTIAYLQANTTTVTNTFVAAGGPGPFVDPDPDDETKMPFAIKEYEVTQASSGMYTMDTSKEVAGLEYKLVMPGTTIPKQAFVKLSRTAVDGIAPAPAYLYLEVIDGLPAAYSWEIDDSNWEALSGVTGVNGGTVYLYIGSLADAKHVVTNIAACTSNTINIIKDNEVVVDKDANLDATPVTLSFNAYLAQASTGKTDDPAAVFTACFG